MHFFQKLVDSSIRKQFSNLLSISSILSIDK